MDDTTALYGHRTHSYKRESEYIGAVRSARLAVTDSGDRIPLSSFLAVQDLSTVATDIFILSCHNSNDVQRNAASIKPPGQIIRPFGARDSDVADYCKNTSRFGSS